MLHATQIKESDMITKISGSFVKRFIEDNGLVRSPDVKAQQIVRYNGQDTQITASGKRFEVRQLKPGITQVIAYYDNEWKLFKDDEIHRGNSSRRGVSSNEHEYNATLTGGITIH